MSIYELKSQQKNTQKWIKTIFKRSYKDTYSCLWNNGLTFLILINVSFEQFLTGNSYIFIIIILYVEH